jgi:hypothetical protein
VENPVLVQCLQKARGDTCIEAHQPLGSFRSSCRRHPLELRQEGVDSSVQFLCGQWRTLAASQHGRGHSHQRPTDRQSQDVWVAQVLRCVTGDGRRRFNTGFAGGGRERLARPLTVGLPQVSVVTSCVHSATTQERLVLSAYVCQASGRPRKGGPL